MSDATALAQPRRLEVVTYQRQEKQQRHRHDQQRDRVRGTGQSKSHAGSIDIVQEDIQKEPALNIAGAATAARRPGCW